MTNRNNNKNNNETITDIASFLLEIKRKVQRYSSSIVLYRGESESFETPCRPTIFRGDYLSRNEYFEISLLDTMRQNKLCETNNYLENAIDAQHGEFPSRLLDLTYNCIIALYFAVTPFYRKKEDSADDKDGKVFIFHTDKIYSPSAQNTIETYREIVEAKQSWLQDHLIFAKNHKFIDNTKINNRIIAQQGAFILFQGLGVEDIPSYTYDEILIPHEAKKRIRKELTLYMGINTGYVYPEQYNLVNDITQRSQYIVTSEFCFEEECKNVIDSLRYEIDYFKKFLVAQTNKEDTMNMLRLLEKTINSYRLGLLELKIGIEKEEEDKRIVKEKNEDKEKETKKTEKEEIVEKTITLYENELSKIETYIENHCALRLAEGLRIIKEEKNEKS